MSSLNARAGWRYGSSLKHEHTTSDLASAGSAAQTRSGGTSAGTGIMSVLSRALSGAPPVEAPVSVSSGDAPRLPARAAAWGPIRRFSTGTHHAGGVPPPAPASAPSRSRSFGAGLLRAASLSRPVSRVRACTTTIADAHIISLRRIQGKARAGPEVYVSVESCQQQDALAAQPVLRSASARSTGKGGLRVARALSVCVSVGSDAESNKALEEGDKRSSVGKEVDVELALSGGG